MHLSDCVSGDQTQTELLLVFSEAAYSAAKLDRDRMTQAILPIDPFFLLREELADVLDNEDCKSLIAALGVGIVLPGADEAWERLFQITKLRYGKIILVTEPGQLQHRASREVLRFFSGYMRPLIDGGHIFALEVSLAEAFGQQEFVDHVLNTATRRLRVVKVAGCSTDTSQSPRP